MLDIWFYFLILVMLAMFSIGIFKRSAPFVMLGAVLLIATGLVPQTEGIWIPSTYSIDANATIIDTNYTLWIGNDCPDVLPHPSLAHCVKENSLVWLSQIFLYLGIIGLLVSVVIIGVAVKERRI